MKLIFKRFEELNTKELYRILKARIEVFAVEQDCVYQDCDNKDFYAFHMYYEKNDEIVAYIRILDKGISYDEISIGRVLVNENYRFQGISSKLMNAGIDFIKKVLNENSIRISAQAHLIHFYGQLGFVKVSDEYLEDNIPHIEMLYTDNSNGYKKDDL